MINPFCNANWVDGSTQKDTIIKNVLIAEKSAVENSTVDFFTTNGERHPQQVADIALSTLLPKAAQSKNGSGMNQSKNGSVTEMNPKLDRSQGTDC